MAAHISNGMMKIPLIRRTLKCQRRASKSKDWASVETLHGTSLQDEDKVHSTGNKTCGLKVNLNIKIQILGEELLFDNEQLTYIPHNVPYPEN